VWDFAGATDRVLQLRRLVRRETIRLIALTAVAGAVFLGTRLIAERAEHLEIADAERWHARGMELLATSPPDAAVAFRRAVMKDRSDKRYVLALAEALARSGNADSAVRALRGLRQSRPEDAEVNLALARLHRDQDDPGAALRYYYHAIYAPDSTPDRARHVRLELIRMLLDAGDTTRAQSELIASTIDLPPQAHDLRLDLGALFERADNPGRAAEQYRRVLADAPETLPAVEGAVRSAFALGEYREVLRYRLPDNAAAEVRNLSTMAREIINRDPLAARLAAAERRRRLLQNITYLEQRWTACEPTPPHASPEHPERLRELRRLARPAAIGRDSEALEFAVAEIDAIRRDVEQRCGERTLIDRALEQIARMRGVGPS
jgi:Tfp pilus assembly protein PilF